MHGRGIRGWRLVFMRVWKEWSGWQMTEEEKAANVYNRFFLSGFLLATSKWSSTNSIPRIYTVRVQSTQMGIIEKHVFGLVLVGPWCKKNYFCIYNFFFWERERQRERSKVPCGSTVSKLHVLMSYLVNYGLMQEVRGLQQGGRDWMWECSLCTVCS